MMIRGMKRMRMPVKENQKAPSGEPNLWQKVVVVALNELYRGWHSPTESRIDLYVKFEKSST